MVSCTNFSVVKLSVSSKSSHVRGIRGAITVSKNSRSEILEKTEILLRKMMEANRLRREDIASVLFSVTADLDAEFPALAARRLGMIYTPLLCVNEINVPGSLRKCIRVLFHVNTTRRQREMKNIYLGKAQSLRPDLHSKEMGLYYLGNGGTLPGRKRK